VVPRRVVLLAVILLGFVAASALDAEAVDVVQAVPTAPAEASASVESLPAWARAALESIRQTPPLLFFAALVVATFLPVPVALFYLTAGVAYGIAPALAWIAGSLVVSNVLIHTASRTVLRPTLEALVARRGHRIPRFDSALDEALFITLIRLTPGIPYFLQNLVLAVAKLDLLRFVVLSVAIQMIYVTGFVVLGRSALEGQLGWAIGGLALIVAVAAGARMLAKRRGT
jgi:uncharacterized membrane protein YdjX (TVP38/TMEM64 family)